MGCGIVLFVFYLNLVLCFCEEDKNLGYCADVDCTEVIAVGQMVQTYSPVKENVLRFRAGDEVQIFVKDYGDKKQYLGVEINGKRGYVPKLYILEKKNYKQAKYPAQKEFIDIQSEEELISHNSDSISNEENGGYITNTGNNFLPTSNADIKTQVFTSDEDYSNHIQEASTLSKTEYTFSESSTVASSLYASHNELESLHSAELTSSVIKSDITNTFQSVTNTIISAIESENNILPSSSQIDDNSKNFASLSEYSENSKTISNIQPSSSFYGKQDSAYSTEINFNSQVSNNVSADDIDSELLETMAALQKKGINTADILAEGYLNEISTKSSISVSDSVLRKSQVNNILHFNKKTMLSVENLIHDSLQSNKNSIPFSNTGDNKMRDTEAIEINKQILVENEYKNTPMEENNNLHSDVIVDSNVFEDTTNTQQLKSSLEESIKHQISQQTTVQESLDFEKENSPISSTSEHFIPSSLVHEINQLAGTIQKHTVQKCLSGDQCNQESKLSDDTATKITSNKVLSDKTAVQETENFEEYEKFLTKMHSVADSLISSSSSPKDTYTSSDATNLLKHQEQQKFTSDDSGKLQKSIQINHSESPTEHFSFQSSESFKQKDPIAESTQIINSDSFSAVSDHPHSDDFNQNNVQQNGLNEDTLEDEFSNFCKNDNEDCVKNIIINDDIEGKVAFLSSDAVTEKYTAGHINDFNNAQYDNSEFSPNLEQNPRATTFWEMFSNSVNAIRAFIDTILSVVPEPLFSYVNKLKLLGISTRAVVFTIICSVPCCIIVVFSLYMEKRSKEKTLTAQLITVEQKLFSATSERNILQEEKTKLQNQLSTAMLELEQREDSIITLNQLLSDESQMNKEKCTQLKATQHEVLILKKEKEDCLNKISELKSLLKDHTEKNNFLTRQLHEKEDILASNEELLDELRKECETLHIKSEELTKSENEARMKISQLEESCSQLLQEAEIWNSRVNDLNLQLCNESQLRSDYESIIEDKNSEIESLKTSLTDLQILQDLKDSGDADEKTMQDKIKVLMDTCTAKLQLKNAESEIESLSEKLNSEKNKALELEVELLESKSEIEKLKHNYNKALQDKTEAQTKLDVLSNYFKDKELQLQKELGAQEAVRQQKEKSVSHAEKQIYLMEEENASYKYQVATLKQELEETERNLKNQIAVHEKKAHENWLAARAAERKLEEVKQEANQLRQRLTLLEREQGAWTTQEEEIIRPIPKRFPVPDNELTGSQDTGSSLDATAHNFRLLTPDHLRGMPPVMPPPPPPGRPFLPPPPVPHLPPPHLPFLPRMDPMMPPRRPQPWHSVLERSLDSIHSIEKRNTPSELQSSGPTLPSHSQHQSPAVLDKNIMNQPSSSPSQGPNSRDSQSSSPNQLPHFHDVPPRAYNLPLAMHHSNVPPISLLHRRDHNRDFGFQNDNTSEDTFCGPSRTNTNTSKYQKS